MILMLGNISPERFQTMTGSPFTNAELATLRENWSQRAALNGPEEYHIFETPDGRPTVTVGSASAKVLDVFKAADHRKQFPFEVTFSLDASWGEDKDND